MVQQLHVRVPATSANLGPGFDSLGIAFELFNEFTVKPAQTVAFSGDVAGPTDESNLFLRAFRAVQQHIGVQGNISVNFQCAVPPARGLGSSSTLIVAGALAANELYQAELSDAQLLQISTAIEGHPDNVAPALFGGLTASFMEDDYAYCERISVCPRLRFSALIPEFELRTDMSRAVLPSEVEFAAATYNIAHAATLILALHNGDSATIAAAMRDRIHQPFRFPLIAGQEELRQLAARYGALATVISGAGPTLLSVWEGNPPAEFLREVHDREYAGRWQVQQLSVAAHGASLQWQE